MTTGPNPMTSTEQTTPRPIYIFDLDGTLADCEHRTHFLDRKDDRNRWRHFYAACKDDRPIKALIGVMNALRFTSEVRIWTGRSDEVRAETLAWLAEHTSFLSHEVDAVLTMREASDHRPDTDLKGEWLASLPYPDRRRLAGVFEDRARVVDMWRTAGVPCFQVAPGEF
jgi:phosphoglycolate phosphatase-like HAD superfamily hydrolase